jgi:signal transduction histidine kinase/CheY-like chemotaxis protein
VSPGFGFLNQRRYLFLAILSIVLGSCGLARVYYGMEVRSRDQLITRTGEQTLGNIENLVADQVDLYELDLLAQLSHSHENAPGIRYLAVTDRQGLPLHDYRPVAQLDSLRRHEPVVRFERTIHTAAAREMTLVLGLDPRVFCQGLDNTLAWIVSIAVMSTLLGTGLLLITRRSHLNGLNHRFELEQERKAKDVAEAMGREKSAFLANVSHEIRTPMNGIVGTVELLGQTGLDEAQRSLLMDLETSSSNLVTLLDKVLDAARIDSGRFHIEEAGFELARMAATVTSIFGAKARQKNLSLTVEIDPDLPRMVRGDAVRLQQVMNNLVGNALKFTRQGWIRVDITQCGVVEDEILAEFRVRDTGVGVPEQALASIFEPFTQADGTSAKRFGGTGLGLSICRRIVELMGGSIHGRNREGGGAEFAFHVPLKRTKEERPDQPVAVSPAADGAGPEEAHLLLVEDNPINQRVLVRMLQNLGYQPVVAADGREGVEMFAVGSFDLVLMDCQMPVMDGYEATAEIRRLEGGASHTPIIATTANAMPGDREKCMMAGMDDFLAKPVRRDNLVAVLEQWLEGVVVP